MCVSAEILCSLQFKMYCIWNKKNFEVYFSFFTAVSLISYGLLLEIFVFYWMNSPTFRKNAQLTCECMWTGNALEGFEVIFVRVTSEHLSIKEEKKQRPPKAKIFIRKLGHIANDKLSRDWISYFKYFIKNIIVCCFLLKCYTTTFSHMSTYSI
jgi:hypothetical protein